MSTAPALIRRGRGRDRQDSVVRKILFYLLIAALVSSMVLTYVWTFVNMAEARIVLRELRRENGKLGKELDRLQARAAQLSSTARIEKLAREKLNMRLPNRVEFLSIDYIEDERESTDMP